MKININNHTFRINISPYLYYKIVSVLTIDTYLMLQLTENEEKNRTSFKRIKPRLHMVIFTFPMND